MLKVEERITEKLRDNPLMSFLGAENVERLKTEITDIIINQVAEDLRTSYDYIISPEDVVSDIVEDIIKTAKEKIRPVVEKEIYERTMTKLGLGGE